MPTVVVESNRRLLYLAFPHLANRDAPEAERWDWPEFCVRGSKIQGFGLYPKAGGAINWAKLERPVAVPYLGKETEAESSSQALVLRSVLTGNFDLLKRSELHTPADSQWVQDGLYVTLVPKRALKRLMQDGLDLAPLDHGEREMMQVVIRPEFDSRGVFSFCEGDEEVCYLLRKEVQQLLHLPDHIVQLLASHAKVCARPSPHVNEPI